MKSVKDLYWEIHLQYTKGNELPCLKRQYLKRVDSESHITQNIDYYFQTKVKYPMVTFRFFGNI